MHFLAPPQVMGWGLPSTDRKGRAASRITGLHAAAIAISQGRGSHLLRGNYLITINKEKFSSWVFF